MKLFSWNKTVVLAFLVVLSVSTAFAHDYYVSVNGNDAFNGSSTFPWRTIQHAADLAVAGDTVHVLPGTYNESVEVISAGGTTSAPIIFKSESQLQAKIRGVGTLPVFQVRSGDHIVIYGFDVSGSGYQGIEIYSSYTKVVGNYVHDIPGGCPTLGGAGISFSILTSHDNLADANVVANIRNKSGACMLVHGIYTSNQTSTITNNVVFGSQGWGIQMWHGATHGTIMNNTLFNNDAGGIIVGAVASEVADGTGVNDYTVVANNVIAYNGAVDQRYGVYENGATGPHNIYVNNLVWQNQPTEGLLQTGTATGNVEKAPMFVNYQPDGTGVYRLQSTSPAIGLGVAAAPTNPDVNPGVAPNHDISGYPRSSSRIDAGAFQYH